MLTFRIHIRIHHQDEFVKYGECEDLGTLSFSCQFTNRVELNGLGRLEESGTSNRSTRARSTRCHKIKRKFNKHMEFFLKGRGSCYYDEETVGDIKVPLRYKHLVKQ